MAGSVSNDVIVHRPKGLVRTDVSITTDASGVATATTVSVGFGRIVGCFYDGGLDASAVITVSDGKTGATLFAYTTGTEGTPTSFVPTQVVTDNAGVAVTAADTAPNVNRDIYVGGRLKLGVASGGNAETGIFSILVDEDGIGDLALTV